MKLQASFLSARYSAETCRPACIPPLSSFQQLVMVGSIELKQAKEQVQKQVQVSAAAETLMVLGHIAAEMMAEHMAVEPAEKLKRGKWWSRGLIEKLIQALPSLLGKASGHVSGHGGDGDDRPIKKVV